MMDDQNAFDRQLASVVHQRVGPSQPVDDLAIFNTIASASQSHGWRFQSLFSATRFVVAAAVVALFGGFVLAGLLAQPSDERAPAAATDSPVPTSPSPTPLFTLGASTPIADDRRRFTSAARLASGEIVVAGLSRLSFGSVGLPAVWTSHDSGGTWTESSLARGTTGEATKVITTEDGFVAIVRSDARANVRESVVWASSDGLDWEELAVLPDSLLTSVIAVPEGLAAVGVELRQAEGYEDPAAWPTIWISTDGRDWVAHEISAPWHEPGEEVLLSGDEGHIADLPVAVARSDAGAWMVSGIDREASPDNDPVAAIEHPAVWVGAPGGEWSKAASPADGAGRFDVVAWRPDGFVVTGEVRDDTGAARHGIWITRDGTDWEPVLDLGPGAPLEVATANDELIAVIRPPVDWEFGGAIYPARFSALPRGGYFHPWGERPDRLLDRAPVFESRDGRSWTTADPIAGFPLAAGYGDDGSFLIVGADVSDCTAWWCAYESNTLAVPTVWVGEQGAQATQEAPSVGGDGS